MNRNQSSLIGSLLLVGLTGSGLGGCGVLPTGGEMTTGSIPAKNAKVVQTPTRADRECLARAMYFESNRTDEDGMLAVGTVVMNRLDNPKYPGSVCEVVGQKRQFANGVLSKPVRDQDRARIEKVADLILSGERHKEVGAAMHFHTAGYHFSYTNMHYVALAGGNQFYEKTDREGYLPAILPHAVVQTASGKLVPIQMASLADAPDAFTTGAPRPRMPSIQATQVAYGLTLPQGVPTRYSSAPAQ
ncbi:cell wall hydrolase [Methylobacterium brachythecii]|uniref:Spore germination cell wall hydrolase CwlJ-like protein n=1 Tax=Methylobacterium brachythecii TaxID=1176177 RepID=A0A7W6F868_9HYPH|nr:cell wall hydrolase [Methylobacterium brachythecii]MBB3904143.1 spore germination cell wall hydrolase CwlJ-like protein [Methylobacterium brachythecii]GLS42886.1 hypothetical protein GCM10007884_08710 [Methylobacterium brachythecii]